MFKRVACIAAAAAGSITAFNFLRSFAYTPIQGCGEFGMIPASHCTTVKSNIDWSKIGKMRISLFYNIPQYQYTMKDFRRLYCVLPPTARPALLMLLQTLRGGRLLSPADLTTAIQLVCIDLEGAKIEDAVAETYHDNNAATDDNRHARGDIGPSDANTTGAAVSTGTQNQAVETAPAVAHGHCDDSRCAQTASIAAASALSPEYGRCD